MNQFPTLDHHHPILARFAQKARQVDLIFSRRIQQVDCEIEMARTALHKIRLRELEKNHGVLVEAFCMGDHPRLGGQDACHVQTLPRDLFPYILSLSSLSP